MDWTDYLPTVPTVLSVLAFLISSLALYLSRKQFARNQQTSIVPVLAFTRRDSQVWELKNIGRGPAVKVLVGSRDKDGNWPTICRHYHIGVGNSVFLKWIKKKDGDHVAATYEDFESRQYSVHFHGAETEWHERNIFPEWKANKRERRQDEYVDC